MIGMMTNLMMLSRNNSALLFNKRQNLRVVPLLLHTKRNLFAQFLLSLSLFS